MNSGFVCDAQSRIFASAQYLPHYPLKTPANCLSMVPALAQIDELLQWLGPAATRKVATRDLGHIEPITMHWGVMELEILDNGVRTGYHEVYRARRDSRKACWLWVAFGYGRSERSPSGIYCSS